MYKTLLYALLLSVSTTSKAQLRMGANSVGVNDFPASGKTFDIKGSNGGQLRLNNTGEPMTSLEFSNNNIRKSVIEINNSTNEFKLVSEATGQSIKVYTQGIERISISPDGLVTMPNGIKFGGNTPTSGTLRWTGSALEIYNGTVWQVLGGTSNPAQDKRNKTNFYLDNDPY